MSEHKKIHTKTIRRDILVVLCLARHKRITARLECAAQCTCATAADNTHLMDGCFDNARTAVRHKRTFYKISERTSVRFVYFTYSAKR